MGIECWRSIGKLAVLCALFGGSGGPPASAQASGPKLSRDEALRGADKYEAEGKRHLKPEPREAPQDKYRRNALRRHAFKSAALHVRYFIEHYEKNELSLDNLVQTFRLGFDLERADNIREAYKRYVLCPPRITIHPKAVWDNELLSVLVERHLDALKRRDHTLGMNRNQSEPNVDATSSDDTTIVVFSMGPAKVGPTSPFKPSPGAGVLDPAAKDARTVHLARGPSQRSLTPDEAWKVMLRQSLLVIDRPQAIATQKALIERAGLSCEVDDGEDGLVVFAVAAPVPAGWAKRIAKEVSRIRDAAATKYFRQSSPDPVPVVVYACLGDEPEGRRLAQAIHFRGMDWLEGYYEPEDNSVVLRKNIRNGDRLFLGTAAHELMHAQIHADFPDAPVWLNEGMASLQEESGPQGPIDNYRLYYLVDALKAGKLPKVEQLVDLDNAGWYDNRAPLMYAMARYLCLYLEAGEDSRNRLLELYGLLRDERGDGGGVVAALPILERVTGKKADDIQAEFVRFVQGRDIALVDRNWGHLRHKFTGYVRDLDEGRPSAAMEGVVTGATPVATPATYPTPPASLPYPVGSGTSIAVLPPKTTPVAPMTAPGTAVVVEIEFIPAPPSEAPSPAGVRPPAMMDAATLGTMNEAALYDYIAWCKKELQDLQGDADRSLLEVRGHQAQVIEALADWKKASKDLDDDLHDVEAYDLLAPEQPVGVLSTVEKKRRELRKTYRNRIDGHRIEALAAARRWHTDRGRIGVFQHALDLAKFTSETKRHGS